MAGSRFVCHSDPAVGSRFSDILKSGVVPAERSDALRQAGRAPGGGLAALQAEMLREMAASLGRASERLSGSLATLAEMGSSIDELEARGAEAAVLAEAIDAFNQERERAERFLWELTVQREALGLRNQQELERYYPLPPRRRLTSRGIP